MALIKCPECGKDISDKAYSCPNCGCPIADSSEKIIEKAPERPITEKKLMNMKIVIIAALLIVVAVIALKSISKKNAQAKRNQQIQKVKVAMDNVDDSLVELIDSIEPEEPFLYGDSSSDMHKNEIKKILDVITENQKVVEDAYKNEDREFIKELDDYIFTNKTYRSWDEYNDEIKKIYGNSISNEQAADNLVKEMASSKKDYIDYKNGYFCLKERDMWDTDVKWTDVDINDIFDINEDFRKVPEGTSLPGDFEYGINSKYEIVIMYLGDSNPKKFSATISLLGTNGNEIATENFTMNEESTKHIWRTSSKEYIDYQDVKKNGLKYGDIIDVNIHDFYSDTNDAPTDLVMEITAVE